jgi:hypothetical protein
LATVLFGVFMIVRKSIDKPTPKDFMKLTQISEAFFCQACH